MKFLTIFEKETLNAVNVEKIEAVVKNEKLLEIKIVSMRYCYYECFKTIDEMNTRFKEIMGFLVSK
jgi:hypothetical protein